MASKRELERRLNELQQVVDVLTESVSRYIHEKLLRSKLVLDEPRQWCEQCGAYCGSEGKASE